MIPKSDLDKLQQNNTAILRRHNVNASRVAICICAVPNLNGQQEKEV